MRGDDAYVVLGLRPGARRAEVDQAYRRLIKRYHPDSAGGDAARAAELNRAYAVLRDEDRERVQAQATAMMHGQAYARQAGRRRGTLAGVMAIGVAAVIAISASMSFKSSQAWRELAPGIGESRASRPAATGAGLDEPLADRLIELSVGDALRLHAGGDPAAAARFSRNCLSRLSEDPSAPLFDSCAAYDEAIAILASNDPKFESGPFNPSAVTARQVGAARLLSADYFEAESRLQEIRSSVQGILFAGAGDAAPRRARVSVPVEAPPAIAEVRPVPPPMEPRVRPQVEPRPLRHATAGSTASPKVRPAVAKPPASRPAPPAPQARRQRPAPQPAQRVAAPSSKPEAATEAREVPAWQKPLKPAWQRPLPAPPRDD
jgi:hypothetical protein